MAVVKDTRVLLPGNLKNEAKAAAAKGGITLQKFVSRAVEYAIRIAMGKEDQKS